MGLLLYKVRLVAYITSLIPLIYEKIWFSTLGERYRGKVIGVKLTIPNRKMHLSKEHLEEKKEIIW